MERLTRRIARRLDRGRPDAGGAAASEPEAPATDPVPPLAGHDADAGLPFDAGDFERRLVWMWGSPRSGSTWLLRQLSWPLFPKPLSTTILKPPGAGREQGRPFDVLPVDESFISNHLAPAFGDPSEVDGSYVPGTLNNYLGGRPVYAYSEAYREVWAPEARRFALVRLYAFLERARAEGVSFTPDALLVIKEVNGSHAADLLMALMPRSRQLFLVRDGRDVVDSLMHAYQPGGFLARHQGYSYETPEERLEGVAWASRLWSVNVDTTLRAIDAHPPELSRTVRYEDLLADNAAQIGALDAWLGLGRDAAERNAMLEATAFAALPEKRRGDTERNRAASPGLWRENLSDEEQRICHEIMGPRLKRLGYETD
jgi:hypothetical protein